MAMAKAKCTCSTCGKQFELRVKRNNRTEADSFEDWAAHNIDECPECRQARIEKERGAENAAAMEAAKAAGLPDLIGSEKQIAWANTIRKKMLDEIDKEIIRGKDLIRQLEQDEQTKEKSIKARKNCEIWIAARADIAARTSASWYIDRRDTMALNLVREWFKNHKTIQEV